MPLKNEHLQTPPTLFSRCARVWQADEHTKRSFTWHAPASNHQPFSTVGLLFFFWDCRYACCHDNQKRAPMSALLNNYSFCGFVRQWWLGVLTGTWVSPPPPDQRATVKACLDDHSAGLRAFFWVFMLLWVVRTLTQLVECGGHIVQYGDSPVSRDIVLCLWYKEKKKKIHVVMMRCNNFFFFSKDLKRPCVGLWNSLVSRESDASPWCY